MNMKKIYDIHTSEKNLVSAVKAEPRKAHAWFADTLTKNSDGESVIAKVNDDAGNIMDITVEMMQDLRKLANTCDQASGTIAEDNNADAGTKKILALCDELCDTINDYVDYVKKGDNYGSRKRTN